MIDVLTNDTSLEHMSELYEENNPSELDMEKGQDRVQHSMSPCCENELLERDIWSDKMGG